MIDKKLNVVVPYRDRAEHMGIFVPHMETFLRNQGIHDFKIRIIEQEEGKPFNRAKLLNVGFALDENISDYYAFHDVDMIPSEADYSYVSEPTHMATECSQFGYQLPYGGYFGGVTLFNKQDFFDVNGYSNEYWGWGAEDDDMLLRCYVKSKLPSTNHIPRRRGVYESLSHQRLIYRDQYMENIKKIRTRTEDNVCSEGLNTLEFSLLEITPVTPNTVIQKVSI
jgi:hypothetical protein